MHYLLALVRYFLYYLVGQVILCRLLPRKISYGIVRFIADAQYFIAYRPRRALISNLKVVWGKERSIKEIKRMAHYTFRKHGEHTIDFFYSSQINKDNIDDWGTIKNAHYMDEALTRGKGVVAFGGHLGNWEMGAVTLALNGYPLNVVALGHGDRRATDIFRKQREAKGIKVMPLGTAIRKCFQAFEDNELVALLGDWDVRRRGTRVKFFGKEAIIPKGAAIFAYKTQAAIVPCFMFKNGQKYELTLGKPVLPNYTGDEKKDIHDLVKRCLGVLERTIRAHPGEWFLFHRIWTEK
jgi:KDO2-lipid IV(A) lauroyltransferase